MVHQSTPVASANLIKDIQCETEPEEPRDVQAAMNGDFQKEWKEAMASEIMAHIENGTWELVDYSLDKKLIGSKFVLKHKLNKMGQIERRKARLVAKGYTQEYGIDYNETFSPVIRSSSMGLL